MDQPELSVIIPAYNVLGYLRQAVSSVAQDSRVEVIIVDDCSTDWTSKVADEVALFHPTVRVIRPESNVGLGRARNLGLQHSRGEYVVFLDGDDYLVEGAFDRLREVIGSRPDVVVFGYARLYPNGNRIEGVQREPLQITGSFTATEHPEILDVLNVAWNKAYRRQFIAELGIEFPVGYYEDIPWTYPILAAARSIVALDEPLYIYRQRWSGSILRSTDARHLEIVDQFERLMGVMDRLNVGDFLQGEVFTRAFRNLVTLSTARRWRVPKALRKAYYLRMRAAVREHIPAGYSLPRDGDKWKLMRAVWAMGYQTFVLRQRAASAVRFLRKLPRKMIRVGKASVRALSNYQWVYEATRRFAAVDSRLVVLENLWGLSPRLNGIAIDRELRKSHPELRLVWSVNEDQVKNVPAGIDFVVKGTRAYSRVLARGKYFFLDTNLPGWWKKRSGQVFTQLHHGTPLKFMGIEERGQDSRWMDLLLRRSQNWDFSVAANAYSSEVWQHSYPVRCETLEYGYPRNDVLVNADERSFNEARTRLGIPSNARVILYMPTFRERDQDSVSVSDLNLIAAALDPDDVLLVRGHYLAGNSARTELHPAIRDVTEYLVVEDLYLAADVLVTDYSSAMFDYSNLGRPIVIFAYDWEEYQVQRGTYFDITVDAPGEVVDNAPALAEVLATRKYENSANAARLERFAQIFCLFETGHAAADVVSRVINGKPRAELAVAPPPALTSWRMDRRG